MKSTINQLLTGSILLAGAWANAPAAERLDSIAAIVNDDIILGSEVERDTEETTRQLAERGTRLPSQDRLRSQVLERLILSELQLQVAKNAGITITDDQLSRTLRNIAADNSLTLDEFRKALTQEGLNYQEFREDLRKQMVINRLRQQQINSRVKVSDEEIDRFIANQMTSSGRESVKLRHLLVSTPEGADAEEIAEAKSTVEDLRQQLLSGADFAALAAEFSNSPTALDGGDLGWLQIDQVPTLFETLVVELDKGDVSDVIASSSGFHLVLMEDIKGEGTSSIVRQTNARHILIRTDELVSDDDARTALENLRNRIQSGEDFGELAKAHSSDPGSAIKGGELGWTNPGDTVPEFEAEMDTLSAGEISQPFRTNFGWHLLQVIDRRDHDNTEQATREAARTALRKRKADDEIDLWLRRMREEAFVEIRI